MSPPGRIVLSVTLAVTLAMMAALAIGCASSAPDEVTGARACLDDQLGELGGTPNGIPKCMDDPDACVAACEEGRSASCLGAAFTLESSPVREAESTEFFRRACAAGLALGCTNYGAHVLFLREHDAADRACVARLFRRSCSAGESFACGMSGRMAFEAARSDAERAEVGSQLEEACERVGAFACRVLAKHIEEGDYGEPSPDLIRALLRRACETGDFDACGDPATAIETFH